MRLVSFGPAGAERPGVLVDGTVIDLLAVDPSLPPTVRGILAADALERVRGIAADPAAVAPEARRPRDAVRLGPPVTDPSKVICLGLNYRDHAEEQGRRVPERPLLFAKGPNALAGDGDAMPYPDGVEELDYEVELAFVIGRRARRVPPADAAAFVAGYAVFMDITARDLQRSERQWFRAKSADGSGPFGPALVTPDEVPDPHDLEITLDVDGETLQSSRTGRMVFRLEEIVSFITRTVTLEPGDVVATGTPAGVGVFRDPPRFLRPGNVLAARIERLGTLRCTIA